MNMQNQRKFTTGAILIWKTWGRTALGLVLLGLLVFGLASSAWAADFRE